MTTYKMPWGQYVRIETRAGGAFASDKDFIRAVYKTLKPSARKHQHRAARHSIIRAALEHRENARNMFRSI